MEDEKKKESKIKKRTIDLNDPKYRPPEDRDGVGGSALEILKITRFERIEPGDTQVRQVGLGGLPESLPPPSYYGQTLAPLYAVHQGEPGIPWNVGVLYLEQRPDLAPLLARGVNGLPGEYQILARSNPWVQTALRKIVTPILSAPWSIERPVLTKQQRTPSNLKALDDQWRWQEGLWASWTARGADWGLRDFIDWALRETLTCGFSWSEIWWPEGDEYAPLPQPRDASTIQRWILWRDPKSGLRPVGVVQQATSQVDNWGQIQPNAQTVIAWDKILHMAWEPIGPLDLEGRSWLRPAFTALKALEDLVGLQCLSATINAVGTWEVYSTDKESSLDPDATGVLEEHFENYQAQHVPYIIHRKGGWRAELHSPDAAVVDLTNQVAVLERAAMLALGGSAALVALQGDGSRAARGEAESSERALLDAPATMVQRALERLIARLLRLRALALGQDPSLTFPAQVTYAQVTERDVGGQVQTLATYLESVRPKLWKDARLQMDEALGLPLAPAEQQPSPSDTQAGAQLPLPDQPSEPQIRAAEPDSIDVPKGVQENAQRALGWLEDGFEGDGFTNVGRQRAAQLARGGPVSPETVRRMTKFFDRFRGQRAEKHALQDGKPTPWRVAWDAWGGDEGDRWSARLVESWDSEE